MGSGDTHVTIIPKKRNVYYDVWADLPTTGLSEGDLAYAHDRLILYRWDSSAWQAITAVRTKETFVPVTVGTTMTDLGYRPVAHCSGANCYGRIEFYIPADLTTVSSIVAVIVGGVTQGAANIDLYSHYGANGEAHNCHSESDTASTYAIVNDQIAELDVSGVFSVTAAGDHCGLDVILMNSAHDFYILGVRLKYD